MKYFDRVKETSTTTGTGNFTLAGAVSQFVTFASRYAVGDPICYCIQGDGSTEWEVGIGHLSDSTTLIRTYVYASSNSDAAVNFSSGSKFVFATPIGKRMSAKTTRGEALAVARGMDSSF